MNDKLPTRAELTGALRAAQARARNAERDRMLALACGNTVAASIHLATAREERAAVAAIQQMLEERHE